MKARKLGRMGCVLGVAALMAAAGAATAQCSWNLASAGQPTVATDPGIRQNLALAFDSVRHKVVLFGGYGGNVIGYYGDTWGWDGESWSQLATTGPTARASFSMAFDSGRGKLVLFGGNSVAGALGDTWEWDGAAWTQANPTASPPGRYNSAMAYDSARGVVVMTGGFSTLRHSDTWEFNGTTWTDRTTATTYGARSSHGMAFDESRNKLVIYGGFNGSRLNDTREFDAISGNWSQIAVTGPTGAAGRQYLGLDYDSDRHLVVLFGGQSGPLSADRLNDTWGYNGTSWTLLTAGIPAPDPVPAGMPNRRDQHAISYDRVNHRMVLFGGYQGGGLGGVAGDTSTWGCPIVACYANCDGSSIAPILNVNDFTCFLNRFAAGESYANCDSSTIAPVLNVNDFTCFLNQYAVGCP